MSNIRKFSGAPNSACNASYLPQLNYLNYLRVIGAAWFGPGNNNSQRRLAISHVVLGASLQLAIFCTSKWLEPALQQRP